MKIKINSHQSDSCVSDDIDGNLPGSRTDLYLFLFMAWFLLTASVSPLLADIPVLSWTPRSDWVNVKTVYGARGDGTTDDTAAIQAALNTATLGVTLYFPSGTYKISSPLVIPNPGYRPTGIAVIGHGAATVLSWYGPTGGIMLTNPGCALSLFIGLKLDGRGIAAVGFDNNNVYFDSESRWQHMAFYNFTDCGVQSNPSAPTFVAEASFENCVFNSCGSGIKITKYNDYDFTITGCDFIRCSYGINCAKGNFYARDCYFEASLTADIVGTGPEHGCSVRRCVSKGSVKFIDYTSSVAPLDVQDCYVSGWTSVAGAIRHTSTPLVLHNNFFANPPNTVAPVQCPSGVYQKVVACNNSAPQSTTLCAPTPTLYAIPAGVYGQNVAANGAIISSFIKTKVTVPSTIFDAKAYGAKGDGITDDTLAIQQAINAAQSYGKGAIAYLPKGKYIISATLTLTGSDYVLGGSGYMSGLIWRGPAGGTMIAISNPKNLKIENLAVGHSDYGSMNNAVDILQSSTGPSYMTYSGVWVYGCYKKQAGVKGLLLSGLGKNDVVHLDHLQGNLRVINSARARILGSLTYEGSIIVDDSISTIRDGFLGFMTRLSTKNVYPLVVSNSNSLVTSDYYTEQGDNGPILSGANGNLPGRITLCGPKTEYSQTATQAGLFMAIDNYLGNIYYGSNQFYCSPSSMSIVHSGAQSMNFTLMGALFYNSSLTFSTNGAGTFCAFGNRAVGTGVAPTDNFTSANLSNASAAFDDLQRLGNLDLSLNFPNLGLSLKYKLDEGTGTRAEDSSGNANTGYLVNGPTWATGVLGSAASFNGTNAYLYSPTTTSIPIGNAKQTISWWQYVSANPGTEMCAVGLKNNNTGTGICVGFKSGLFGVWKFETKSWLLSASQPTVNEWHHCAYTFDGIQHRLYVDGTEVANSTTSASTSVPSLIYVAAAGGWAGAANFAGKIDDVRIYQRALSSFEIQLINALGGY